MQPMWLQSRQALRRNPLRLIIDASGMKQQRKSAIRGASKANHMHPQENGTGGGPSEPGVREDQSIISGGRSLMCIALGRVPAG